MQLSVCLNLHCAGIIRSRDTPTMFSYLRPQPTHPQASVGPRPTSGESMWGLWGRKYSLGHILSSKTSVFSCLSSLHQYSLFIYLPTGGGMTSARYTQQYHRTTILHHYGNTRNIYSNIIYFILYTVRQRIRAIFKCLKKIKSIGYNDTVTFIRKYIL